MPLDKHKGFFVLINSLDCYLIHQDCQVTRNMVSFLLFVKFKYYLCILTKEYHLLYT